jgi:hypothetical protein
MAPIKFEDDIREKLQNREITPSAEAWAKLDRQLEPSRPRRGFRQYWWAVAAAIVLIAVSAPQFFLTEEASTEIAEEEVVQEQPSPIQKAEELLITDNPDESAQAIEQIAEVTPEVDRANTELEPVERTTMEERTMPALASAVVKQDNPAAQSEPEEKMIQSTQSFEDAKVDEVVAQVQQMNQNGEVSAEEVEALLLKAQRDISNRKMLEGKVVEVDAGALLMDVETEIERTFRDRVFEALGEGFEKVRTAVAERNN